MGGCGGVNAAQLRMSPINYKVDQREGVQAVFAEGSVPPPTPSPPSPEGPWLPRYRAYIGMAGF